MDDDSEVRITLRLPGKLRDRLSETADANSRSMNGEIVFRLERFEALESDLRRTTDLLADREKSAFSARAELRNAKSELEEARSLLEIQGRESGDLREIVEYQRIIIEMSDPIRSLLSRILDEAQQGKDDALREALRHSSERLTSEQEDEIEKYVQSMREAARHRAQLTPPSSKESGQRKK